MRRNCLRSWLAAAVAALVMLSGGSLSAAPAVPLQPWPATPVSVGQTIKVFRGPGHTGGGEFIVSLASQPNTGIFDTFCLEASEHLSFNTAYKIQGISDRAFDGGVGPAGDPISSATAYLYHNFYHGTLSSYHYGNAALRANDADALQRALWFLEGEAGGSNAGQSGVWILEAQNAIANQLWSGIGDVRVMNFNYTVVSHGGVKTVKIQDLLTVTVVPEPSTMAVWSLLGVGCVVGAWVRRKRQQALS